MNLRHVKSAVCRVLTGLALLCLVGNLSARDQVITGHYPPGLAEHLNDQLSSRTNGSVTAEFVGPTDGSNFFWRQPTNKPNFWLLGVTNIFAQSQFQFQGGLASCANYYTCIAPHFCVTANHAQGTGAGRTNVWLLPDGSYFTNDVIAGAQVPNTDIEICLMRKTNWTVCKILPDITAKVPFLRVHDVYRFTPPVFVRFHQGIGRTNWFHSSFVSSGYTMGIYPSGAGYNPAYPNSRMTYGDYSLGDNWVGGDSSGAAYAVINNEAALVGTAYTATWSPPLGLYTNEINAAMASLCNSNALPVETLTIYDLSNFRDL